MNIKRQVSQHIQQALQLIGHKCEPDKFKKLYPFTTENLKGYLPQFNGVSSVLTVAASGDHALNCVLLGATHITLFDINPLSYYMVELKKTAITYLNYADFIAYFLGEHLMDYYLFNKFSAYLKADVKSFWLQLYHYFNNDGNALGHSDLFNQRRYARETILGVNMYLHVTEYVKVQKLVRNVTFTFYKTSVTDLPKFRFGNLDLILLSNIADYLGAIYTKNSLSRYKALIDQLSLCLNPHGKLVYAYLYLAGEGRPHSVIDDLEKVNSVFKPLNTLLFNSIINKTKQDAVLIHKKEKGALPYGK